MLKSIKTTRHPNVLKFLDCLDAGETVYVVTERVAPLFSSLNSLKDDHAMCLWGIRQMLTALDFLNNTCHFVHGNITVNSVFVTPAGDWKLGGLELLKTPDQFRRMASTPIVGVNPPEVKNCMWSAVANNNPWSVDAYGLGCLIATVFSGQVASSGESATSSRIPDNIRNVVRQLVHEDAHARPNPGELCKSTLFGGRLIELLDFVESLNVKTAAEKRDFYVQLPQILEETRLPAMVAKHKLVPALRTALELDSANAGIALGPLLRIGSTLDPEDFDRELSPFIVKMFSVNDRSTRMELLQRFDVYEKHLTPALMNDQIFPQLANGFLDAAAPLRELTVKAMLFVVPKLKPKTVQQVLRYFAKLQLDPEPGIRTNTTICLGKLASHVPESDHARVLIPAFTRALRDPFPPARIAGLLTLMATQGLQSPQDVVTKAIPAVAPLLLDPTPDVRTQAAQCMQVMLHSAQECSDKMASCETPEEAESLKNTTPQQADRAAGGSGAGGDGGSSGGLGGRRDTKAGQLLGWAMSSLKSKLSEKMSSTPSTGAATANTTASDDGNAPGNAATSSSSYQPPAAPAATTTTSSNNNGVGGGGDDNTEDDWLSSMRNEQVQDAATPTPTPVKPPAASRVGGKKLRGMKLGGERKQQQDSLPMMPDQGILAASPSATRISGQGSASSLGGDAPRKFTLEPPSEPSVAKLHTTSLRSTGSPSATHDDDWGSFNDFDTGAKGSKVGAVSAADDWGFGGETTASSTAAARKSSVADDWGFDDPITTGGGGSRSGGGGAVLQPTRAAPATTVGAGDWGDFNDEFDPVPKNTAAKKTNKKDDWDW
eukprot:TRINITY_DN18014_c0_g1_i1.p1 TRINITY_DN18014_c0_g1~~TRINITY_DN18014_c0_g1_i1.p1  ORF type:complete len:829 (+),score=173.57 TRINITY_DN18014_c0_g1_i1:475-2961(+)